MRKDKGITLIALVITIIILLILAGVAMSTLTGNDNIIKNAGTTVENYNTQQETDEAVLNTIAGYLESHMPKGENGGGNDGTGEDIVEPAVDKTPPTITAKQESVTITEGQKYLLSEYFTIEPDATTEGVQVAYTINGQAYADTETLTAEGSPYTVTCAASKNGGESASATMTIVVEPSWYIAVDVAAEPEVFYGASVNYEDPAGDPNVGWKIFHSDGENIYIIADDYIHYTYIPPTRKGTVIQNNGNTEYCVYFPDFYTDYDGSANILDSSITDPRILKWIDYVQADYGKEDSEWGMKCTAYMLDSTSWSAKYRNNTYAEYAIGGPTLEMFAESYNKLYDLNIAYEHYSDVGYMVGKGGIIGNGCNSINNNDVTGLDKENTLYINDKETARADGYWIASPYLEGWYNLYGIYSMNMDGELWRFISRWV